MKPALDDGSELATLQIVLDYNELRCFRFWNRRRPGMEPGKRAPHPSSQTRYREQTARTRDKKRAYEDLWPRQCKPSSRAVSPASEDTFEQMKKLHGSLGSIRQLRLQSHRTASKPSSSSRLPWIIAAWAFLAGPRTSSYLYSRPSETRPSKSRDWLLIWTRRDCWPLPDGHPYNLGPRRLLRSVVDSLKVGEHPWAQTPLSALSYLISTTGSPWPSLCALHTEVSPAPPLARLGNAAQLNVCSE
jgi:hypothetical protein